MDWTELIIEVPVEAADTAADIANMAVPYGITWRTIRIWRKGPGKSPTSI